MEKWKDQPNRFSIEDKIKSLFEQKSISDIKNVVEIFDEDIYTIWNLTYRYFENPEAGIDDSFETGVWKEDLGWWNKIKIGNFEWDDINNYGEGEFDWEFPEPEIEFYIRCVYDTSENHLITTIDFRFIEENGPGGKEYFVACLGANDDY